MLLKYPLTLENTKFIAGEISLKVSLVLYIPIGHYKPDKGKNEGNKITNAVITRSGKNWYVNIDNCIITINAYSYTIITAHKEKK